MLCKEETTNWEFALLGGMGSAGVEDDVDNEEEGRTECSEPATTPGFAKISRSCCKNGEFEEMMFDIVNPF